MLKTIFNMLVGALITAAVSGAYAVVGTPPGTGPALIDGAWLNGLASGVNFTFQSGITAKAGGVQATCTLLPPNTYLISIDTVASTNDSVCLPFSVAGTNLSIANTGAQTLAIFGQAANNPLSGTADTINATAGSSAYTLTTNTNAECFAVKNGAWKCVKGS
jgi:hypothetical protein